MSWGYIRKQRFIINLLSYRTNLICADIHIPKSYLLKIQVRVLCQLSSSSSSTRPKSQDEFIAHRTRDVCIGLLDAGVVDDLGREVRVDGCDFQLHCCDYHRADQSAISQKFHTVTI